MMPTDFEITSVGALGAELLPFSFQKLILVCCLAPPPGDTQLMNIQSVSENDRSFLSFGVSVEFHGTGTTIQFVDVACPFVAATGGMKVLYSNSVSLSIHINSGVNKHVNINFRPPEHVLMHAEATAVPHK